MAVPDLERRFRAGDLGHPPTAAEIIRKGRREPIFDTGWVVLKDRARGRVVLRSLDGKPDRWLPKTPPLGGEILLKEKQGLSLREPVPAVRQVLRRPRTHEH